MKKTYTFEVKRKAQYPKMRCPKCNSGLVEIWHLVDADHQCDKTQSFDPAPYNGEWQYKCFNCELEAPSAHTKRIAKKAWKHLCESYGENND